jgi:von Willebrand factor type A domain
VPVPLKQIGALFSTGILTALVGCGSSGSLRVTKVAVSTQKPGNIALYLDVRDNGRPVPGLQEKDFKVYEDGKLIPAKKGKRALLDADVVSANFALVQVDLSGPIADSEHLPELAETVAHFAQDLNERQEVAVSAFDGNDEVAPFIGFGAGKEQFRKLAEGLRTFRPRSRNSNLYGAVYQGISTLEEKLANTPLQEKQATLIVFTDRGDLSHTVGIEQMKEKLRQTGVQVYLVGAGDQINRADVTMLGRTGSFISNDPRAFKKGFEEINQKMVSLADGRYVFSFCSTKRKGSHKLEVQIETPAGDVKVTHKFNAAGFKAGCSPKTKPVFEEIEAMKAESEQKAKEIAAKEKEKEEAEAAAAAAAIKEPPAKDAAKDNGKPAKGVAAKDPAKATPSKDWAKEMAKASAKEPAKPAPAPAPAAAKDPAQLDLPPPAKEAPKPSGSAKQAVDNE